tara:strand:+ start:103 stop:663 length:561 start_codon:yes stop_codon:yes gene_type:complete
MDSRVLIIHEYQILFEILNELSESLNFKIIKSNNNNLKKVKLNLKNNYVIISKKKFENEENILILDDMPIKFENFVEIINVNFLKKKFSDQSYIKIGKYSLDLNSRKITAKDKSVSLTERETNIIIFINENKDASIKDLQKNVWNYSTDLETHTVETHIYRLRKKMKDMFGDENFIFNTSNGYSIG